MSKTTFEDLYNYVSKSGNQSSNSNTQSPGKTTFEDLYNYVSQQRASAPQTLPEVSTANTQATMQSRAAELSRMQDDALKRYEAVGSDRKWWEGTHSTAERDAAERNAIQAELDKIRNELITIDPSLVKYRTGERIMNTLSGAAKDYASGVANALSTLGQWGSEKIALDPDNPAYGTYNVMDDRFQEQVEKEAETQKQMQEWSDKTANEAAVEIQKAKAGLGTVGQFGVDVGVAATQLLGDTALNLIPGVGTAALALRGGGSAAREARQEGADLDQQIIYGTSSALLETLTEKISGLGNRLAYGKGWGDDLAEAVIGKLAKSDGGRTTLRLLAAAISEGNEEAITELLNPALKAIYDNGESAQTSYLTAEGRKELLSDAASSALVGAALGGVGAAGGIATGYNAQQNAQLRLSDAERKAEDAKKAGWTVSPQDKAIAQMLESGAGLHGDFGDNTDIIDQLINGTITEPTQKLQSVSQQQGNILFTPNISEQRVGETERLNGEAKQSAPAAELDPIELLTGIPVENKKAASEETSKEPYTIERDSSGAVTVRISEDALAGKPRGEWATAVRDIIKQVFGSGLTLPRGTVYTNKKGRGEFSNGSYTKMLERTDPDLYSAKMKMAPGTGAMVENADNIAFEPPAHVRNDDIVGFNRGNIRVIVEGKGYSGDVLTAIYSDGKEVFFDVNNLARKKDETASERYATEHSSFSQTDAVSSESITQVGEKGKRKIASPTTSEVVDADGNMIYKLKNAPLSASDGTSALSGDLDTVANNGANYEANASNDIIRQVGKNSNREFVERGFSENVRTDTNMEESIRRDFDENREVYQRLSNEDTLAKAQEIFRQGLDPARDTVVAALAKAKDGSKLAPEMVPLARMVANELTRQGNIETARRILSDVAAELTEAGQLGQAANILRNADPITALDTIQKAVDNINEAIGKKYGGRFTWRAELTEAEIAQIENTDFSQDGAFEEIYTQIGTRLGQEMPATLWEKLTEIRRINMLLRPRTLIKNTVGNIPMAGLRKASERLSGAIQDAWVKSGKLAAEKQTRTANVTQESKTLAKEVYPQFEAVLNGQSDKWDLNGVLRENRTIFKAGALEQIAGKIADKDIETAFLESARRFTYDRLKEGDAPFVKSAFVDSLAQYCSAHNITDADSIPQAAIDFATANAMEATFKATNAVAKLLNQLKSNGGLSGAALDVLFPFTTTPLNITAQMLRYSPAEIANVVRLFVTKANRADLADSIAKMSTGTAVMALGLFLRALGVITAGEDEDKDKAAYDKSKGVSSYSFRLRDGSYSYDWAQPAGSLLALGAEIADGVSGDASFWTTVANSIYTAGDSVLNMSLFQNVLQVLKGTGKPTQQVIDSILEGGATQLIPGLLGDIARIVDGTVRSTYTGGNVFDDSKAKIISNIPGLSKTLPASVNSRGEEVSRGSFIPRTLNVLLNPSTTTYGKEDAATAAIDALYEATGNKTIFPQVSPYKVDYGTGYTMSGEERAQFQTTQGQTYYDLLNRLIESGQWEKMSEDAQVKALQQINEYAKDAAKRELVTGRGDTYTSDWDDEANFKNPATYLATKAVYSQATKDENNRDYDAIDIMLGTQYSNLSATQRETLGKSYGRLDDMYDAYKTGIDSETWFEMYDKYKDVNQSDQSATKKATEFAAWVDSQGLSPDQATQIKEQLAFSGGFTQTAETYEKLRDAGLVPAAAETVYDIMTALTPQTGNSGVTQAQKIDAVSNMGLTDEEKFAIISIYVTDKAEQSAQSKQKAGWTFEDWAEYYTK